MVSTKKPKATRTFWLWRCLSNRWFWIAALVIAAAGAVLGRSQLRRGLRWAEARYFAHIGDKGPLLRIQAGRWVPRAPGLWTRLALFKRKRHWSRVRLRIIRMDPRYFRLQLWWKPRPHSIRRVLQRTGAWAAINGGLFDPKYRPLGYTRIGKELLNDRLHRRSKDGVAFWHRGRLQIAASRGWKPKGHTIFQSAPLLVARGLRRKLAGNHWKVDRRSALCLMRSGRVLLMATDGLLNGLSYYELGLLMAAPEKRGGFGCWWGLNLDGGSSSQWAIRTPKGVEATIGAPVPLFLLVQPKKRRKP